MCWFVGSYWLFTHYGNFVTFSCYNHHIICWNNGSSWLGPIIRVGLSCQARWYLETKEHYYSGGADILPKYWTKLPSPLANSTYSYVTQLCHAHVYHSHKLTYMPAAGMYITWQPQLIYLRLFTWAISVRDWQSARDWTILSLKGIPL